ncbi:hypothetical protein MSTO_30450 [Mycobacterium stomatepiae]|uniref:Uncharacterized protein n=1 Tax=Mycobacterium stomatepiae TaxID=470076 RepID=A0A7I7Q939_9MYCO|nr:hypothetical protein MSTO_30450 [Mycobacterium stomatepiae]
MTGGGGGAELEVVVDSEVELVGVAAGGDAVSEHDAMARPAANPISASRNLGMLRPWNARISNPR